MDFSNLTGENEVRKALKEWMAMNSFSQAEVARKIGRSDSVISQYLAGKYTGNNSELTHDILSLMAREFTRKLENVEIPKVLTTNAKDILAVCSLVHQTKVMGVIHGGSGYGKTTGLKLYMERHNQSIMITAFSGISSGALMSMLLDQLRPKRKRLRLNHGFMMKTIIEELTGKDLLLIIDEAQHLTYTSLEKIRAIHDATETPVIYSGNNDIIDRMTGAKQFDYDQIYSRVPIVKTLDGKVKREDVWQILAAVNCSADTEIVRFLEKKANEQGHFRKIKHLLSNAIRFAKKDKIPVNIDHLRAAEQLLLGKRYSSSAN